MVAAAAAADAVARARRLRICASACIWSWSRASRRCPRNSCPISSTPTGTCARTSRDSDLISARGPRFGRSCKAEIDAQFRAYQETGLALDHVNAHKHFHLHPAVANEVIAIGQRYGMRGLRIPREPAAVLTQVEPGPQRSSIASTPWPRLLGRRVRRAGLRSPDRFSALPGPAPCRPHGLRVCFVICPAGTTEIYLHPATHDDFAGAHRAIAMPTNSRP